MTKSFGYMIMVAMAATLVTLFAGQSAAQGRGPSVAPTATAPAAPATTGTVTPPPSDVLRRQVCDILTNGSCPGANKATVWNPDYKCMGPVDSGAKYMGNHCYCDESKGYLPFRLQRKWAASARPGYTDGRGRNVRYYVVDVVCAKSAEKLQEETGILVANLREEMRQAMDKSLEELNARSLEERTAIYAEIKRGDDAVMTWVVNNFTTPTQVRTIAKDEVEKGLSRLNQWPNRVHLNLDLGPMAYKLPNSSYIGGCFAPSLGIPFGQSDWGANVGGRFCYGGGTNFNRDGSARWAGAAGLTMHFTYALSKDKQSQLLLGGSWMEIVRESGIKMAGYTVGPELGVRIAIPGLNAAFVPMIGAGAVKDTARDNPVGNGPQLGVWGGLSIQASF